MSIAAKIKPVAEVPVHLKMLLYGRSGTGKTTFVGTAPKPLLILDPREKGTVSVRRRPDTDYLALEKWDDFEEVYWFLQEGSHKYKTVAIDTVTQLQDLAITKIVGEGNGPQGFKQWGEVSGLLKTWILLYRDLGMHVLFTAQDRETQPDGDIEEGSIDPEVGPRLMPSAAATLNAAVDVIANTFIREKEREVQGADGKTKTKMATEYCLRLGPHARYVTKIRVDVDPESPIVVPKTLVNPSFQKVLTLVEGEK